ncbi:MAG: HD domain-containing protein, partial [Candidatus Eremiobacteraeota bacterium]|nr:HD domain-containing protein [Candidatus Eremiobacteraeota bacterium]
MNAAYTAFTSAEFLLESESESIRATALAASTLACERSVALDLALDAFMEALTAYLDMREAALLEQVVNQTFASSDASIAESVLLSMTRTIVEHAQQRRVNDSRLTAALGAAESRIREKAEHTRRAQRRRFEPVDELDALIDTLMLRIAEHDPVTAEHSRAVSAWCGRIARRLGLDAEGAARVARGGMIHDLGKIATPQEILLAARALEAPERDVIQMHSAEGDKILAEIPYLAHLAPMVRSHHERIDGKGYPDGVKASRLDVSVRIVTVADAFNAMVGRRPYRQPARPSAALDELYAGAGSQFDAEIVEAM